MKNKKSILSGVTLAAGIISVLYCICQGAYGTRSGSFFTPPEFMVKDNIAYILASIGVIASGVIGLSVRRNDVRLVTFAAVIIVCVISCVTEYDMFTNYFMLVIVLNMLIVHLLSKEPNKKLYFVYGKGNIYIVVRESRPTYESIAAEAAEKGRRAARSEAEQKKEKNLKRAKSMKRPKTVKPKKRYTGYAISPNSKSFNKKRKRKNKKR